MTTELLLKFDFLASHSLSVREEPHLHLWKIQAKVVGEPNDGMLVNLLDLRNAFELTLAPLRLTYLNENPMLDQSARATPTCETLGFFLCQSFQHALEKHFHCINPTLKLNSVQVSLCEPDGFEWGAANVLMW